MGKLARKLMLFSSNADISLTDKEQDIQGKMSGKKISGGIELKGINYRYNKKEAPIAPREPCPFFF